jgi:hypothetical protein
MEDKTGWKELLNDCFVNKFWYQVENLAVRFQTLLTLILQSTIYRSCVKQAYSNKHRRRLFLIFSCTVKQLNRACLFLVDWSWNYCMLCIFEHFLLVHGEVLTRVIKMINLYRLFACPRLTTICRSTQQFIYR